MEQEQLITRFGSANVLWDVSVVWGMNSRHERGGVAGVGVEPLTTVLPLLRRLV